MAEKGCGTVLVNLLRNKAEKDECHGWMFLSVAFATELPDKLKHIGHVGLTCRAETAGTSRRFF